MQGYWAVKAESHTTRAGVSDVLGEPRGLPGFLQGTQKVRAGLQEQVALEMRFESWYLTPKALLLQLAGWRLRLEVPPERGRGKQGPTRASSLPTGKHTFFQVGE